MSPGRVKHSLALVLVTGPCPGVRVDTGGHATQDTELADWSATSRAGGCKESFCMPPSGRGSGP